MEKKRANGNLTGRIRERIAEALNVSNGQVAKIESVSNNAIEPIKEAVASGSISLSTASEIAKLSPNEQQEVIDVEDISEISHSDIKKKVTDKRNSGVTYDTISDKSAIEVTENVTNCVTYDTPTAENIAQNKTTVDEYLSELAQEDWSNGACIGYAIKTCESLDFSQTQTAEFVTALKRFFEEKSVTEARKIYEDSRY